MTLTTIMLLGFLGTAGGAPHHLEILPSFDAAHCSWRATHVIIAEEGESLDGRLEVLRSLKGDLRVGATLTLPALGSLSKPQERRVWSWSKGVPPRVVSGNRLLLYLQKTPGGWKGAGWGDDLLVSFAWLEPDGPFARVQVINSGPLRVSPLNRTTADLVAETMHVLADREARDVALAVEDEELRSAALVQVLLSCSRWHQGDLALLALQKGGASGLRRIQGLLADDGYIDLHPIVAWALDKADPAASLPVLRELARRELAFWSAQKVKAERFEQTAPRDGVLAKHYRRVHAVLRLLNHRKRARGIQEVEQLLQYWDKHPDLDEWLRYTVGYRIEVTARLIRKS